VLAYNFGIDDNYTAGGSTPQWMDPMHTWHEVGQDMELYEGNSGLGTQPDNIHGTHQFGTYYRNYFYGDLWNNPTKNANTELIHLWRYSRFFNFVGNVLGAAYYNNYQTGNATSIFNPLGQPDPACSSNCVNDPYTTSTLMRWGNYDSVTAATRWCGNSSDTGWSTTCGSTSEVPTGIPNYSNPVPTKGDTAAGQGALPASFYLSGQPSWWVFPSGTNAPFPAVGPDVIGGQGLAGHAYYIPAENCWRNVMGGVIGSSGLLSFNAATCYGSNQNDPPAPPTGLNAQVQ